MRDRERGGEKFAFPITTTAALSLSFLRCLRREVERLRYVLLGAIGAIAVAGRQSPHRLRVPELRRIARECIPGRNILFGSRVPLTSHTPPFAPSVVVVVVVYRRNELLDCLFGRSAREESSRGPSRAERGGAEPVPGSLPSHTGVLVLKTTSSWVGPGPGQSRLTKCQSRVLDRLFLVLVSGVLVSGNCALRLWLRWTLRSSFLPPPGRGGSQSRPNRRTDTQRDEVFEPGTRGGVRSAARTEKPHKQAPAVNSRLD